MFPQAWQEKRGAGRFWGDRSRNPTNYFAYPNPIPNINTKHQNQKPKSFHPFFLFLLTQTNYNSNEISALRLQQKWRRPTSLSITSKRVGKIGPTIQDLLQLLMNGITIARWATKIDPCQWQRSANFVTYHAELSRGIVIQMQQKRLRRKRGESVILPCQIRQKRL